MQYNLFEPKRVKSFKLKPASINFTFVVKKKWFDKIINGEKNIEYREFTDYWIRRLLLDDFGVQADSEWEKRTLYDLIDARWENRLLTIITSNKNPNEFKELFDGRIYSRLAGMTTVVVLTGKDYRLPEKLKF